MYIPVLQVLAHIDEERLDLGGRPAQDIDEQRHGESMQPLQEFFVTLVSQKLSPTKKIQYLEYKKGEITDILIPPSLVE